PGLRQSGTITPDVEFPAGSLSLGANLPAFNLFPADFTFPLALSNFTFRNQNISTINPNIRAPYVQSWSFGIQRELPTRTVFEVRYVGNRGVHLWHAYNVNEVNTVENGFLAEFQNAQRNLALN